MCCTASGLRGWAAQNDCLLRHETGEQIPCPVSCRSRHPGRILQAISYLERVHCGSQIVFRNAWELLYSWPLSTSWFFERDQPLRSNLHTTFNHKTFETLDTSVNHFNQFALNRRRKLHKIRKYMCLLDCLGSHRPRMR